MKIGSVRRHDEGGEVSDTVFCLPGEAEEGALLTDGGGFACWRFAVSFSLEVGGEGSGGRQDDRPPGDRGRLSFCLLQVLLLLLLGRRLVIDGAPCGGSVGGRPGHFTLAAFASDFRL